jgi:NADH-quinone oxidoreductase subunit B/C/D
MSDSQVPGGPLAAAYPSHPSPAFPSPASAASASLDGGLLQPVDLIVNWARANSLWPLVFGTSCCAIEMMATGSSHNDWARFGLEVARASPRQADLIILAGTLVEKMGARLQVLYEQMPEPKYVIAMGACTVAGGPFYYDSYSVIKGADRILPVDVYIPGCPPRPEALLHGIMALQELIRKGRIPKAGSVRLINTTPIADTFSDASKEWDEKEKAKQESIAEAQAKFKEENPDYKGFQGKRVVAPKFDEVARTTPPRYGMEPKELWAVLKTFLIADSNSEIAENATPSISLTPSSTPAKKPAAKVDAAKVEAAKVDGEKSDAPAASENISIEEPVLDPDTETLLALGPEGILDVTVAPAQYRAFMEKLQSDQELGFDMLLQLSAVEQADVLEVVSLFVSSDAGHSLWVRTPLTKDALQLPTLADLYPAANWHERETYDFFGIAFTGHPDLRRLFLEDDFPGHPLRKDFEDPSRVVKRPY